ncbi:MAG: methionine--tRNA ligase subunit beta [bacterium]|nr:methionine--tRNA ligase subunit beta [bacterium]
MITFEDFKKLDLRVAKIIEATRVEGSDKLVKLRVDAGDGERQMVAGVLTSYGAEDLPGRHIVVVANLESRNIMGIESQGMLLAADGEAGPVLLMPDHEVPPGTKIR